MWQKLKKRLVDFEAVAGIEVDMGASAPFYRYVILKKNKEEVELIKFGGSEKLQEIRNQISKEIPVSLIFSGKGVLHKKVNVSGHFANLLKTFFPNAAAEDFSAEINSNWISLIRKTQLKTVLESFQKEDFKIININIGSLASAVFVPLLESGIAKIPFGKTSVKFIPDGIQISKLIEDEEKNYSDLIKNLEIEYYPAYASGISTLLAIENQIENVSELSEFKREFEEELLFKKLGWFGLISFLVILLINFFLFSNFSNRQQELSYELAVQGRKIQLLDSLSREVENYNSLETQSNLFRLSQTSFYADEIAQTIPNEILLSILNIFPVHQDKKDKKLKFDFEILLKGTSSKSSVLNAWINKLKEQDWIKEVQVLPYSESTPGRGEFELRIVPK